MPLISVIVPVYNVEKYLHRCVDSILAQTFTDFELILVDDGSTDDSGRICDEYANKDYRITIIHQNNAGVSFARNAGINVARGEFLVFVDSDDYISELYLQNLILNKSDLTISGTRTYNDNGNLIGQTNLVPLKYDSKRNIDFILLYEKSLLYSPYSKLFKTKIINAHNISFPENITWGEDGMFVADYIQHVNELIIIPHNDYFYIKYDSNNSLSTKIRDNIFDTITYSREYCINRISKHFPNLTPTIRDVIVNDIMNNSAYFIKRLFESDIYSKREKIHKLSLFYNNEYVSVLFHNPSDYFDGILAKCIKNNTPRKSIVEYYALTRKNKLKNLIYYRFYSKLPASFKNLYRLMKRKVNDDT